MLGLNNETDGSASQFNSSRYKRSCPFIDLVSCVKVDENQHYDYTIIGHILFTFCRVILDLFIICPSTLANSFVPS